MLLFETFVDFKIDISRVDNHTFPGTLAFELVNLDANIWVLSHDIQLLARQSEDIQPVIGTCILNRDNIGDVGVSACQPCEPLSFHDGNTLLVWHFPNVHNCRTLV